MILQRLTQNVQKMAAESGTGIEGLPRIGSGWASSCLKHTRPRRHGGPRETRSQEQGASSLLGLGQRMPIRESSVSDEQAAPDGGWAESGLPWPQFSSSSPRGRRSRASLILGHHYRWIYFPLRSKVLSLPIAYAVTTTSISPCPPFRRWVAFIHTIQRGFVFRSQDRIGKCPHHDSLGPFVTMIPRHQCWAAVAVTDLMGAATTTSAPRSLCELRHDA